jgi:transmembrane sensor
MTQQNNEFLANTNTKEQTATRGSDSPQDQAREWLSYLYSAEVSPDKRQEFIQWINNSEQNCQAFKRCQQIWQTIGMTDSAVDWLEQYTYQGSVTRLKSPVKHRLTKSLALLSSIAASIALLAINGVFSTTDRLEILAPEMVFTSPIGENRSFTLADGSAVTLAGDSSIVVDIDQYERRVNLRKGSAYFDVAHEPSRIFSVTAQYTQVRVRGTTFEVKRSIDSVIKISVQRGLVDVVDMPEHGIVDDKVVQLHANEQLRTNINGAFITDITPFDPETEFAWLKKRLIYDNAPLKNVIMDINRYAKKPVVILDESLNDFPITASFTFEQIDQMLASLTVAYPITLTEEDTRSILTKQ